MCAMLADPDGYSPDDIIFRLHRCIDTGTYGIDYTIDCRDKNERFFEEYIITENERIEIIRKLRIDNYDKWEYSNNAKYPDDIVYFFHYDTMLIPRGLEGAKKKLVNLYIKITWTKPTGIMIVISFHD